MSVDPSIEVLPGGVRMLHADSAARHPVEGTGGRVQGFAIAVEPVEAREARWELLREAQWSLREWERHRRPVDRARLVASLEQLAALVRAEPE